MNDRKRIRRITIALLVLLFSVFSLYWLGDSPSLSAEMAFRRKEKQELIGPAKIIGTEEICYSYYNRMIVGSSEYGYSIFVWCDGSSWDQIGDLNYFPKQENVTLFLPLDGTVIGGYVESWLPVMAFAEDPSAVRAQLTLELEYEGERNTYFVDAAKSDGGYFLFRLEQGIISQSSVAELITVLSPNYDADGTLAVTLSLYDRNGQCLNTYSPELVIH